MYYEPEFLNAKWSQYLDQTGKTEEEVDPDAFVRWTYAKALQHRAPRYAALAENWGLTINAEDIWAIKSATDFDDLIAGALAMRAGDE